MLTEELQNTARVLGETLHDTPAVQAYLQAQADCAADPAVSALEERLAALYQELMARQQQGEVLPRSEVDAFNTLKGQVQRSPRVQEREAALSLLKQVFAGIADEIDFPLGVEYSALARAGGA